MHRHTPKVFVDTAIFRYATSVKLIQVAKLKDGTITSKEGVSRNATILFYENIVKINNYSDEKIKKEQLAIRKISELASNGKVYLCYSHEVNLELLFQPEVDLVVGRMHDAPCHMIHSPLLKTTSENFCENDLSEYPFSFWSGNDYKSDEDFYKNVTNYFFKLPIGCFISRLNFKSYIVGLRETHSLEVNASMIMYPFLASIDNKRYIEILNQLNAKCVGNKNKGNLYLDAYHLWTAEESKCDYILTLENALINQFKSPVSKAISPENLLAALEL